MELWDVLRRRKMVRHFRQDPVPRDVIDRVMASVLHAPSAGFTQGNEFLVLTTSETIAAFLRLTEDPEFPTPDDWAEAIPPVVVFPLSNRAAYLARYSKPDKIDFGLDDPDKWPAPFWDIDAGMASMLILLAAIDAGLAACSQASPTASARCSITSASPPTSTRSASSGSAIRPMPIRSLRPVGRSRRDAARPRSSCTTTRGDPRSPSPSADAWSRAWGCDARADRDRDRFGMRGLVASGQPGLAPARSGGAARRSCTGCRRA